MTFLRCIILLQLTSMCAVGQLVRQSKAPAIPEQPGTIVQSLYNEVVARHPVGIPMDADIKTFAPYLSKSLLHGIDLAQACQRDYYRTHQNSKDKPELDWLEFGLFTGGNEKVSPGTFRVEKTEPENDGSFRVYVRLTWGSPSKPWIWQVAAIVTREEGRFVVDDVVFLEDENTLDPETRLSEILKSGCSGSHWIGYGELRAGLQQDASCVSVHLIPEKAHYKLNETFSFRVSIENCGRGDLYLERYANLAGGGNLILNVHEAATERKIYPHLANISDAVPPFDDQGRLPVVLLGPAHSFDSMKEIKVRDYFRKAGRYSVTVSYASVLPKSATAARPVWDESHAIVESNTVTVIVE